jgi:hypothetical protein
MGFGFNMRKAAWACLVPLTLMAQTPEKGALTGVVVNSTTGRVLNHVEVGLEGTGTENAATLAVTDATGAFRFANLSAGTYRLKAARNGYLDATYPTVIVLSAGQELKDICVKLAPFGVIAGTVRESDGELVARPTVEALRVDFSSGHRRFVRVDGSYTDDLGQYRVTGLPPGRYFVRATPGKKAVAADPGALRIAIPDEPPPPSPEVLLPALYPGVQDATLARTVEVEPGGRVTGADIVLARSRTVTVKGHVAGTPDSVPRVVEITSGTPGNGPAVYSLSTQIDPNGDFEFAAVPRGSYVLGGNPTGAKRAKDDSMVFIFDGDRHKGCQATTPLEVADALVEGVRISTDSPAAVKAHVSADGANPEVAFGPSFQFERRRR